MRAFSYAVVLVATGMGILKGPFDIPQGELSDLRSSAKHLYGLAQNCHARLSYWPIRFWTARQPGSIFRRKPMRDNQAGHVALWIRHIRDRALPLVIGLPPHRLSSGS